MEPVANPTYEICSTESRRLDRAIAHINTLWFPINTNLLEDILLGLNDGNYDLGFEFLIDDLKKDIFLYLYCVRTLSETLSNEGVKFIPNGPCALFEAAGRERIIKVLSVNPHSISQHRLDQLTDFQAKQLAAAITSATTAETLAENCNCHSESAYITAILRQLGLLLISWNYPSIYKKALKTPHDQKTLDETLSKLLGFTPLLLVFKLIKDWGISSQIKQALNYSASAEHVDPGTSKKIDGTENVVHYLATVCEVGEALARANQPDIYSSASQDWNKAREIIQGNLGSDGLQIIAQHAQEYCSAYSKCNPELVKMVHNLNPEQLIHNHLEKSLLDSNPLAERCPPLSRKLFKEYYRVHATSKEKRTPLSFLFKEVFPSLGFTGAVVYTIDTEQSRLVVRLRVGDINEFALKPLFFRKTQDQGEPAVTAFHCSTLVQGQLPEDEDTSFIASRLGLAMPIGVLYAELPASLFHETELDFPLHFKAFQLALQHAFGITN